MQNILYGVSLYNEGVPLGQVKNLWIWNNKMDSGTLLSNQGGYVEGTDYFMTAAPNYTPYAYPHPLAGGTLPPPPINNLAITIAPMTAALGTGQTQTFAATVTGGTAPTIAWFWTTGVSAFQMAQAQRSTTLSPTQAHSKFTQSSQTLQQQIALCNLQALQSP